MNNEIDLDKFLIQQRQRLEIEEKKLLQKRDFYNKNTKSLTSQLKGFQTEDIEKNGNNKDDNEIKDNKVLFDITDDVLNIKQLDLEKSTEKENFEKNEVQTEDVTKKWVNQKEFYFMNSKDKQNVKTELKRTNKNKDDMEQWVTDTFYSYFPGFNNEYQKRQNYLRDRQRQNQENFLKHRAKDFSQTKKKYLSSDDVTTARSTTSATSSTTLSHTNDKTDLQIIVNNPDYVSNAKATRPKSTRQKLLQDLRHIELSKMIAGDGVKERNLHNAEVATERKKNYQRDLMHQIEEKRRSIEQLREKERKQEHIMTRRLEDQLKAIKLQEQFEKEKLAEKKLRFNIEKNRMIRANFRAKLENEENADNSKIRTTKKDKDVIVNSTKTSSSSDLDNNKVYKYFSNSAHHEYRRGQRLPATETEWSINLPILRENERECFHLSDKICPNCNEPLKKFEFCCLRCQKTLSVKPFNEYTKRTFDIEDSGVATNEIVDDECINVAEKSKLAEDVVEEAEIDKCDDKEDDLYSFSLVCVNCDRLYLLCKTCLSKSDVCRACHRKRNVCMNCRRSLCSFCLEEVARGKDVERSHINEHEDKIIKTNDNETEEHTFKVLQTDFSPNKSTNQKATKTTMYQELLNNNNNNNTVLNALAIKQNADFEILEDDASKNLPKVINSAIYYDINPSNKIQDINSDILQLETNNRISRYVTNYGDIALRSRQKNELRDRSTQTFSNSTGRRDIVINEDQNLSMPLLREMPKMTRKESDTIEKDNFKNNKIETLAQRWEIPAVQKHSISVKGPKVLTQIGAFRKQLQTERLLEYPSSDDQ